MKRERYQCPNCSQACTRKWNLKVHIERNHAGKRGTTRPDVSSPSTRVQFTSLKTKDLERNDYPDRHTHDHNDQISRGIYPSNNLYSSPGFGSKIKEESTPGKITDLMDDIFETYRKYQEMTSIPNQNKATSDQSAFAGILPFFARMVIPQKPISQNNMLPLLKVIYENRNVGYRGRTCYNYKSSWVDILYDNEKEAKFLYEPPPPHKCDPKKIVDYKHVDELQTLKDDLQKGLMELLLNSAITSIVFLGFQPVHLKAIELDSRNYAHEKEQQQTGNSPNIGNVNENSTPLVEEGFKELRNLDEKHWAFQAIKNGEYVISIPSRLD
ncbi:MAG: hypothetical protein WA941_19865 [Nitrososphaeraceae archaeon]